MSKKYHAAVFIGRMQPFHQGHSHIVKRALDQADEVIIVVGSSFAARSFRNPFTFDERKTMIKQLFPQENVKVVPVSDYPYDDNKWVAAVQSVVMAAMKFIPGPASVALVGHKKDETSYYLNLFKQWNSISVENLNGYNATTIREYLLNSGFENILLDGSLNDSTMKYILNLQMDGVLDGVKEDHVKIAKYVEAWESAPFPPTFITGDAVLTQSGSVLLIKRGDYPFKDKWAIPGGYPNSKERILDGVIRELREETRVKVPEKVLRGSIKESHVFDHPSRDPRGRTITHAYHVDLGFPTEALPKVKGSDDAKEARWFLLGELNQEMMAFDHWHILNHFLKLG